MNEEPRPFDSGRLEYTTERRFLVASQPDGEKQLLDMATRHDKTCAFVYAYEHSTWINTTTRTEQVKSRYSVTFSLPKDIEQLGQHVAHYYSRTKHAELDDMYASITKLGFPLPIAERLAGVNIVIPSPDDMFSYAKMIGDNPRTDLDFFMICPHGKTTIGLDITTPLMAAARYQQVLSSDKFFTAAKQVSISSAQQAMITMLNAEAIGLYRIKHETRK